MLLVLHEKDNASSTLRHNNSRALKQAAIYTVTILFLEIDAHIQPGSSLFSYKKKICIRRLFEIFFPT